MTATEILRRLLDEHGVKHKDFFDQTWWEDSDGAAYIAVETRPLDNNNPSTKLMLKRTATPEQAIAATLGSCNWTDGERTNGTCHVKSSIIDTYEYNRWEYELSCGHVIIWEDSEPPNYCPNCGARCVG